MIAFDLDPATRRPRSSARRVALRLRELFAELGLECFAKHSGSKGIQVYVPLNTEVSYEQTKPYARAVAQALERPSRAGRLAAEEGAAQGQGAGRLEPERLLEDDRRRLLAALSRATVGLDAAALGRGRDARRRRRSRTRSASRRRRCSSGSPSTAICSRPCSSSSRSCPRAQTRRRIARVSDPSNASAPGRPGRPATSTRSPSASGRSATTGRAGRESPRGTVLDVACGTGNAAIPARSQAARSPGSTSPPSCSRTRDAERPRPGSRSNGSRAMPRSCRSTTRASMSSPRPSGSCSPPITAPPRSKRSGCCAPGGRLGIAAGGRRARSASSSRRSPSMLRRRPRASSRRLSGRARSRRRALRRHRGRARFEDAAAHFRFDSVDEMVEEYSTKFGPLVLLPPRFEPEGRWPARGDLAGALRGAPTYADDGGIGFDGEYLVMLATNPAKPSEPRLMPPARRLLPPPGGADGGTRGAPPRICSRAG